MNSNLYTLISLVLVMGTDIPKIENVIWNVTTFKQKFMWVGMK